MAENIERSLLELEVAQLLRVIVTLRRLVKLSCLTF